jgi:hypothetical protein
MDTTKLLTSNNALAKELEIQVVREWWDKLQYITNFGYPFITEEILHISEINGYEWKGVDCVEIVVNAYERIKKEDENKYKQSLIDKKAKLMAELAEINKQLGE